MTGRDDLSPVDLATVLFFLAHDQDEGVREGARRRLMDLPGPVLREVASARHVHPKVLDALARLHYLKGEIAVLLASHPDCDHATRVFLADAGIAVPPVRHPVSEPPSRQADEDPEEEFSGEDQPVDEESEAFKSKYQLSQTMGVAEKIKIAQTGDKEWRTILIKDSNKLVSGTVIRNPRVTEAEVLSIAKSSIQNDDILRVICANKEWVKNYQIRKALVENHKTPLPNALRYLSTLTEKDLAHLAKSKNISSVLSTQARKLLMSKKKH